MAAIHGREDANRHERAEDTIKTSDRELPVALGAAGTAALSVSKEVYSLKAVLAAAYKLSDRCAVLVDAPDTHQWVLFLVGRGTGDATPLIDALVRELTDQALRDRLESEFGALRTLIVAQAFSEGNLLDPMRDGADHNSDPRGTGQRR